MTDREPTPMDRDAFADLAVLWLLGELDDDGAARFAAERARRGAAAEAEIRALRETLGEVALAADPVAPPAGLRARVLEDVAADVTPIGDARPSGSARVWRAATAGAAAIAVVAGLWALSLRGDRERLRADLDAARERVAAADSAAERLAEARRDLDVLASPTSAVHSLAGTEARPTARARIFVDPATGRAILFAYELPILPPDRIYELWAIEGETPRPAGAFRVGEDGRGRLELDPAVLEGADALAVTAEPEPGLSEPTGDVLLLSPTS